MLATIVKSTLLGLTLGAALAFTASPAALDNRPGPNVSAESPPAMISVPLAMLKPVY
jgi:hypothetical protein